MSFEKHIGLVFACPFNEETRNCPMKDFRFKYSIPKSLLAWKMMSDVELMDLIDKHHICLAYREKGNNNF
ncbi:hypothetical protein [Ancylomarina sp.]|uniref:hypothetical protein n=1 Tax=Ancylomarina sp. TaxID=1970196 RepID=UPI003566504E